jgi:hypothetical protein
MTLNHKVLKVTEMSKWLEVKRRSQKRLPVVDNRHGRTLRIKQAVHKHFEHLKEPHSKRAVKMSPLRHFFTSVNTLSNRTRKDKQSGTSRPSMATASTWQTISRQADAFDCGRTSVRAVRQKGAKHLSMFEVRTVFWACVSLPMLPRTK